jgi:hypothetical protein
VEKGKNYKVRIGARVWMSLHMPKGKAEIWMIKGKWLEL